MNPSNVLTIYTRYAFLFPFLLCIAVGEIAQSAAT